MSSHLPLGLVSEGIDEANGMDYLQSLLLALQSL
jgi:hypothetical protein